MIDAIGKGMAAVEKTGRTCAYAHSTLTRLLVTAGAVAVVAHFWGKKKKRETVLTEEQFQEEILS